MQPYGKRPGAGDQLRSTARATPPASAQTSPFCASAAGPRLSATPAPNDTSFARELGDPPEPYEALLHAAMVGDHQYFAREDSVEETWRVV